MLICYFPEAVCLLGQSLVMEGCKKQGLKGWRNLQCISLQNIILVTDVFSLYRLEG